MRRVFYPASPYDVLWGFLSFLLAGGLVAGLLYAIVARHTGGAAWGLIKLAPIAFLGLSRMLYRQRVVMDLRRRTIRAEKWFFLIPLGSETFPVSEVASVAWQLGESGFELTLQRNNGETHLLAKAGHPDEALEKELQRQLGCNVPVTNG